MNDQRTRGLLLTLFSLKQGSSEALRQVSLDVLRPGSLEALNLKSWKADILYFALTAS
jgi:hypothetical protein